MIFYLLCLITGGHEYIRNNEIAVRTDKQNIVCCFKCLKQLNLIEVRNDL